MNPSLVLLLSACRRRLSGGRVVGCFWPTLIPFECLPLLAAGGWLRPFADPPIRRQQQRNHRVPSIPQQQQASSRNRARLCCCAGVLGSPTSPMHRIRN